MNPKALKYILDIQSIISEIEEIKVLVENNFEKFQNDFVVKRASERELEIIGEAIKNLIKVEPNIQISGVRNIIGLRNLIIHSYDSIEDEIIWSIIQKDIPILKQELEQLR